MEVPSVIKEKKSKIKWNENEDTALMNLMKAEKLPWKEVAERMVQQGFSRDAKQCRDRYCNYLANGFIDGSNEWTEDEDKILLLAFQKFGPKWTQIAKIPLFKNKTQNQLKNRFYHSIKKRTEYNSTSIVLKSSRPKGRPSNAKDDPEHRSQTVIPFERNTQNLIEQHTNPIGFRI